MRRATGITAPEHHSSGWAHTPWPEEELTLLLASTNARRATQTDRLPPLVAACDPSRLLGVLNRQRLAGLAILRLSEIGETAVADELMRLNHERALWNAKRSVVKETFTRVICEELSVRGIVAVPIKGALLAHRLYGDASISESNDIDLLVPPESLFAAAAVLRERFGYRKFDDPLIENGLPDLHLRLLAEEKVTVDTPRPIYRHAVRLSLLTLRGALAPAVRRVLSFSSGSRLD